MVIELAKKLRYLSKLKRITKKKKLVVSKVAKIPLKILSNSGDCCKYLGNIECNGNIRIGSNTSINGPGTRLSAIINNVIIGNFCSIASNVIIQEYNHKFDRISTYYINKNICDKPVQADIFSKGDIVIGDDVWIGSNSVILSGVNIGRGVIIGAGSVVTKDIAPYTIVGGNPAKEIKMRFGQDVIDLLEKTEWWLWNRNDIKKYRYIFNYSETELIDRKDEILQISQSLNSQK